MASAIRTEARLNVPCWQAQPALLHRPTLNCSHNCVFRGQKAAISPVRYKWSHHYVTQIAMVRLNPNRYKRCERVDSNDGGHSLQPVPRSIKVSYELSRACTCAAKEVLPCA